MLTDERIYELFECEINSYTLRLSFARAVEREARREALEEAAKVCEAFLHSVPDEGGDDLDRIGRYSNGSVRRCAYAIRALIDKEGA